MTLTDDLKSILNAAFRNYEQEGVPSSGIHSPAKASIRSALSAVVDSVGHLENLLLAAGYKIEPDKASLDSGGAPGDGESGFAIVHLDSSAANNGTYYWNDTQWVKISTSYFPQDVLDELDGKVSAAEAAQAAAEDAQADAELAKDSLESQAMDVADNKEIVSVLRKALAATGDTQLGTLVRHAGTKKLLLGFGATGNAQINGLEIVRDVEQSVDQDGYLHLVTTTDGLSLLAISMITGQVKIGSLSRDTIKRIEARLEFPTESDLTDLEAKVDASTVVTDIVQSALDRATVDLAGTLVRHNVSKKLLLGFGATGNAEINGIDFVRDISSSLDEEGYLHLISTADGLSLLSLSMIDGRLRVGAFTNDTLRRIGAGLRAFYGSPVPSDVSTVIDGHFSTGQSLDIGGGLDRQATTRPVVSTTPPTPYAIMFNTGARGVEGASLVDDTLTDFVALIEREAPENRGLGETQSAGEASQAYAEQLNRGHLAFTLHRTHGHGGQKLEAIDKGSNPYSNGLKEISRAILIAKSRGLQVRVPVIGMTQGEADRTATSVADWKALAIQLLQDYNADWLPLIKTQVGQSSHPDIVMAIHQLACNAVSGTAGNPAIAQYELARDQAGFYLIGPSYIYNHLNEDGLSADGTHRPADSYRLMGAYRAKAWDRIVNDGGFAPMMPTNVSRSGTEITITCANAIGDLVLDTDTIRENTDNPMGFEYSGASITDVSVTGKVVTLTIDADAGGTLRYAYTSVGATPGRPSAWGNVRDSDFSPCQPDPQKLLWNWLPTLEETIS